MDLLDDTDAIYAVYAQEYLWHPVELYIILSSAPEEVLHAIKVEAQGETHGLVQGVALCCGYAVCGIHGEDTHVQTCTNGEILSVALVGVLVVIACTQHEAVIVGVLCTEAPAQFLKFLLETAGSITETLEDTSNGTD